MSELPKPVQTYDEWTYHEDDMGIIYCIGREVEPAQYEAVAVYEKALGNVATKSSIVNDQTYQRLMYHGLPEEDTKLDKLHPDINCRLLEQYSVVDSCLYIDPSAMVSADEKYRSIEYWLGHSDKKTASFREALDRALKSLDKLEINSSNVSLYGGVAAGLVGASQARVEDVDLLLDIPADELLEQVQALQTAFTWQDIDPDSVLSERRRLLKAKRWSTSQVRFHLPNFLSVDFKLKRDTQIDSRWEKLVPAAETYKFHGLLKVVDDTEGFCISPTLSCEDLNGNEKTVLMRGYTYIGSAIKDDQIAVTGDATYEDNLIIVSNATGNNIAPDFTSVPIS